MPTASLAQRELITAVADAVAMAADAPVMISEAVVAAAIPFNRRTRDVCLRSGWLARVAGATYHYRVTPAGYRQIDRPEDSGTTHLPDDPRAARVLVERAAVRGRFIQYLGMFHGWRLATLRADVVTKSGIAGIIGDRVLVGADPVLSWNGIDRAAFWATGADADAYAVAIWSARTGVKTSVRFGEVVPDEPAAGGCEGCADAMVAGVLWPAADDRAPLRETFAGLYRARACGRCDACADDEAAARALAEHLRGCGQEVTVKRDEADAWWVVLRALVEWPQNYRDVLGAAY